MAKVWRGDRMALASFKWVGMRGLGTILFVIWIVPLGWAGLWVVNLVAIGVALSGGIVGGNLLVC